MDMLPDTDVFRGPTDHLAVFHDDLALADIANRQFVPHGNRFAGTHPDNFAANFHSNFHAGRDRLDHGADIIFRFHYDRLKSGHFFNHPCF